MRQRCVHAKLRETPRPKKQPWDQPAIYDAARFFRATSVASAKGYVKRICRQIPVAAKETASALPEIRNHYNVSLVITSAGFDPCFPLAHVVGCPEVRIPVAAPDLQAAEFVDQKEVNHAGNRIRAVHGGGAILQNIDVINHGKREQVNVHASAEPDGVQRTKGDTFSINEHQRFLGQQAAQIELDSTVAAIGDVQVDGAARLLRQKSCQVRRVTDAQFFEVCWTIRIHWIGTRLFRRRNVRASDDDTLHFGNLTERDRGQEQTHCRYAPSSKADE